MRKHLLASAAAIAALAAVPAWADGTAAKSVTVDGDIALKCTLTITNAILPIGEISTGIDGKHAGGQHGTTVFLNGSAMCNGAKNIVALAAHPLTTTTAPVPDSFTNRIDYRLAVGNLVPGTLVLDTASTSGASSSRTEGAFANDGTGATFSTLATSKPVIAGDYHASVDITLTAAN